MGSARTLARARERDHPGDAIPVYWLDVGALLDRKSRAAHREAVNLMARIERLNGEAGDRDGWTDYPVEVMDLHRRKSSFVAVLRERGWVG